VVVAAVAVGAVVVAVAAGCPAVVEFPAVAAVFHAAVAALVADRPAAAA
jgi:hypothetical protein